jgi:tRNA-intron endonuclease
MDALLRENRIWVTDRKQIDRLLSRGFGEREGERLELSLLEGLYLLERGTLSIREGERDLTFRDLSDRLGEEDLHLRYRVYRDLRERGYIVRTGLKFGAHFRVYGRGEFLDGHSRFLVHAVPENASLSFPEVSRAVRLAQGVKKSFLFAVVDDEGDITYLSVNRLLP